VIGFLDRIMLSVYWLFAPPLAGHRVAANRAALRRRPHQAGQWEPEKSQAPIDIGLSLLLDYVVGNVQRFSRRNASWPLVIYARRIGTMMRSVSMSVGDRSDCHSSRRGLLAAGPPEAAGILADKGHSVARPKLQATRAASCGWLAKPACVGDDTRPINARIG